MGEFFCATEDLTDAYVSSAERFCLEGRTRESLGYLEAALSLDPECYAALVAAGETYLLRPDELGLNEEEGEARAFELLGRAIALRPEVPEAYAARALACLYQDDWDEAVRTTDAGFPWLESHPDRFFKPLVWTNIAESLYRVKALALLYRGDGAAGREVLGEGLSRFPESLQGSQGRTPLPLQERGSRRCNLA